MNILLLVSGHFLGILVAAIEYKLVLLANLLVANHIRLKVKNMD